ncbi:hypothetical protein B0H15DRAFT_830900 [Mycena belliarum]|uniref:Uncharacterized protein n=1 Tax=Mycena belliarum TaxID=1033014 RepID=A0AAD6XWS9_9AGAR|nr:hypothetical protein B0H15DRAFT_830900 [Mycena belliae]
MDSSPPPPPPPPPPRAPTLSLLEFGDLVSSALMRCDAPESLLPFAASTPVTNTRTSGGAHTRSRVRSFLTKLARLVKRPSSSRVRTARPRTDADYRIPELRISTSFQRAAHAEFVPYLPLALCEERAASSASLPSTSSQSSAPFSSPSASSSECSSGSSDSSGSYRTAALHSTSAYGSQSDSSCSAAPSSSSSSASAPSKPKSAYNRKSTPHREHAFASTPAITKRASAPSLSARRRRATLPPAHPPPPYPLPALPVSPSLGLPGHPYRCTPPCPEPPLPPHPYTASRPSPPARPSWRSQAPTLPSELRQPGARRDTFL